MFRCEKVPEYPSMMRQYYGDGTFECVLLSDVDTLGRPVMCDLVRWVARMAPVEDRRLWLSRGATWAHHASVQHTLSCDRWREQEWLAVSAGLDGAWYALLYTE